MRFCSHYTKAKFFNDVTQIKGKEEWLFSAQTCCRTEALIPSGNLTFNTTCKVAAIKDLPVHRYGVDIFFIFSGHVGEWGSTL